MIERAKYYASLLNSHVATGYFAMPRRTTVDTAESLRQAMDWICRAQDATNDGGVARSYALG